MNNMLWSTGRYAVFVLFIFPAFLCGSNFASIDSVTSENMKIEGDRISIQVEGMELGKILKAIEDKTGFEFYLNKSLLGKEITVDFKDLSVLEGIKKVIYPLNYAIVYGPGDVVSKIVIVDRSSASPITALNAGGSDFLPESFDIPSLGGTPIEGESGAYTPPGSEITQIEGPLGTNVLVQVPPASEIAQVEGPPGTDALVHVPPDSENTSIAGPPGNDGLVQTPPGHASSLNDGPPGTDISEAQTPPPYLPQDSDSPPK